jgi:hypothetical protein
MGSKNRLTGKRVLLVDDDLDILATLKDDFLYIAYSKF